MEKITEADKVEIDVLRDAGKRNASSLDSNSHDAYTCLDDDLNELKIVTVDRCHTNLATGEWAIADVRVGERVLVKGLKDNTVR